MSLAVALAAALGLALALPVLALLSVPLGLGTAAALRALQRQQLRRALYPWLSTTTGELPTGDRAPELEGLDEHPYT